MDKYLEYYQFREVDENGKDIYMYCTVKEKDGKITFSILRNYNDGLEELKKFANANKIYTTEDLINSDNLHVQMSNDDFRKHLEENYNVRINNKSLLNLDGKRRIFKREEIDFAKVLQEEPESQKQGSTESLKNFKEGIDDPKTESDDGNKEEIAEAEGEKTEAEEEKTEAEEGADKVMPEEPKFLASLEKIAKKVAEKLNIKKLRIKKILIGLGIVAAVGASIKACGSKSGNTSDLYLDGATYSNSNSTEDDELQDPPIEYYDTEVTVTPEPTATTIPDNFEAYLSSQGSDTTKEYMRSFKANLAKFNGFARNYIDVSKNSRLGLDTDNFTAYEMALLGSQFGKDVTNVSTYYDGDTVYKNYQKVNSVLKQLATVQTASSGFADTLTDSDQKAFYQKYENLIIDLNNTTNKDEKMAKAEKILSEIKTDYIVDSESYKKEDLFRSNPKYIATMPLIRSFYDRTKGCNYDNAISKDKMKELSTAYKEVVTENIFAARNSINVVENVTPSYEMYMKVIADDLNSQDLYVIDDERNIKDTALYQENKKLPAKEKVVEVTPTPTATPIPTATPAPVETSSNYTYYDSNDYYTYDDNSNYEYVDDSSTADEVFTPELDDSVGVAEEEVVETPVETPEESKEETDNSWSDQIIESDEGTGEITPEPAPDTTTPEVTVDDNQVFESEEEIVNDMNDTISNGGYAQVPDGWTIDDEYLIDGSNVIDGSVTDISIEPAETATEEVPTYQEDTTTQTDEVAAPAEENYDTVSYSEPEEAAIEEVPIYDETSDSDIYDETAEESLDLEELAASADSASTVDQIVAYNESGINAIPVYDKETNTWHVEVIDDTNQEVKTTQYNI